MTIWFDMDGTIGNLYAVENWLPKLRAFDPSPYAEAEPLVNMEELTRICKALQAKGVKIGIISWLSKTSNSQYNRDVRKAKREWLAKHFPIDFDAVHIVKYGYSKRKVAGCAGDVLIDDEENNVMTWTGKRKADRIAINCKNNNGIIIAALQGILSSLQ